MGEISEIPSPGIPLIYGGVGAPAVVVLHDRYGRLPWLEPFAEAMADRGGFRVVVPDLYQGIATMDDDEAGRLEAELPVGAALDEIAELIAITRSEGSARIGIVGFGAGGRLALLVAQGGDVDAAVAYDATLGAAEHGVIPAPVLLNLPEAGEWRADAEPESFISRLHEHGTPVTRQDYLGTRPGFANATAGDAFDAPAAASAFARTTVFLESQLHD